MGPCGQSCGPCGQSCGPFGQSCGQSCGLVDQKKFSPRKNWKKNHRTLAAICETFILVGDVEVKSEK